MKYRTVKLGDVITANYGKALPKNNRVLGAVPVYGSSGMTDYHNHALADGPGLIIGRKGSIGSVFLCEGPFFPIDTTYYITQSDLKGLDIGFAYYLLKYLPLQEMNTDSAVPGLNRNNLYSVLVNIPDMSTQLAITNILRTIDDKVNNNQRINSNLLKLGISLVIREIKTKRVKIKRIGELRHLMTVSDHVANGSFKALKENVKIVDKPGFALFLRNTDLKRDLMDDRRWVTEHSYNFLKKSHLYGGEVIISNVGDVGSVHRVPYLDEKMVAGNNVIFMQSNEHWITDYLYLYFKSNIGQHDISAITSGSAQQKFNKTDFRAIKVPFVNESFVKETLSPILRSIDANKVENQSLIQLRDLLLPKLLAGDIDLSNIETVMNNA